MMLKPWDIAYEEAEAFISKTHTRDAGKETVSQMQLFRESVVTIGAVGGFSSGKTTCINGVLGYPLLPVSVIPTTTAECKIEFSKIPYMKVIWKEAGSKEHCVVNYDGYMEPEIFDAYRLFFTCAANGPQKGGIGLRNAEYFKNSHGEVRMSDTDIREGIMMALAYFGAYLEPNPQRTSVFTLKRYIAEMLWSGRPYMDDMMEGKHYRIEVGWPSLVLKGGIALIDIPGLSAASQAGKSGGIHDKIACEALQNCDALMLVYRGQPMDRDIDAICGAWLAERMKNRKPELGFIHVINFIDQMADQRENLLSIQSSIDAWEKKINIAGSPVFGICALADSENIYVKKAICEREQISSKGKQYCRRGEATDFDALIWYLEEIKAMYIIKSIAARCPEKQLPERIEKMMDEVQKLKTLTGNIK